MASVDTERPVIASRDALRLRWSARAFDDRLVRDAQLIPAPPASAPRFEPQVSPVRIRIDGAWRHGHVQRWARLSDGWAAWLSYQADPEHPTVAPVWGWYRYDPEAIRPA